MIDYDLVEKIGATHYDKNNGFLILVREHMEMAYWDKNVSRWLTYGGTPYSILNNIKPIPPKPQVRFEYEIVDLTAKEFFKSMIDGEVFYNHDGSGTYVFDGDNFLSTYSNLILMNKPKVVYRRVEKPVDWRDKLEQLMKSPSKLGFEDELPANYTVAFNNHVYYIVESEFIEMCHLVAELTEKPKGEL